MFGGYNIYIIILTIKHSKHMSDQDFKAGVTDAVQAYYTSLSGAFPVQGFSFSYTPGAVVPPAETVQVSLPQ